MKFKLLQFVIVSSVYMLPGTIAYKYLGYAGREAITGSKPLID